MSLAFGLKHCYKPAGCGEATFGGQVEVRLASLCGGGCSSCGQTLVETNCCIRQECTCGSIELTTQTGLTVSGEAGSFVSTTSADSSVHSFHYHDVANMPQISAAIDAILEGHKASGESDRVCWISVVVANQLIRFSYVPATLSGSAGNWVSTLPERPPTNCHQRLLDEHWNLNQLDGRAGGDVQVYTAQCAIVGEQTGCTPESGITGKTMDIATWSNSCPIEADGCFEVPADCLPCLECWINPVTKQNAAAHYGYEVIIRPTINGVSGCAERWWINGVCYKCDPEMAGQIMELTEIGLPL